MGYLKLVYLAEVAVVFNMAFGEWKHEKVAAALKKQFDSLDYNCDGKLLPVIAKVQSPEVDEPNEAEIVRRLRWQGRCVKWLDELVRFRREPQKDNEHPFLQYFNRIALFSTPPGVLGRDANKWKIVFSTLINLPFGLLANWVYYKTPWPRPCPPARSTPWIWFLCAAICISLVLLLVMSTDSASSTNTAPSLTPYVKGLIVFFGGLTTAFLLRPAAMVVSKVFNRYPPNPMGRYYSLILIAMVTLFLMVATLLEGIAPAGVESVDMGTAGSVVWWFFFGALAAATVHPILLFGGYLALETTIEQWTNWADRYPRKLADRGIEDLRKKVVNPRKAKFGTSRAPMTKTDESTKMLGEFPDPEEPMDN